MTISYAIQYNQAVGEVQVNARPALHSRVRAKSTLNRSADTRNLPVRTGRLNLTNCLMYKTRLVINEVYKVVIIETVSSEIVLVRFGNSARKGLSNRNPKY